MAAWMHSLAERAGTVATGCRLLVRSFGLYETNPVPSDWQHITKIDPEDEKKLPVLFPLYLRHTDAVSVGGSADVTAQNTLETFELLSMLPGLSAFHEPSAARHVTDETQKLSDFLAVPEVLNGDSQALVGTLGEAVTYLREEAVPEQLSEHLPSWVLNRWGEKLADFGASWVLASAVFEAYIIQNPDSAAAREANVTGDDVLTSNEAKQRALAAEKHLSSEVVYVEYSGTFGEDEGLETVSAISDALSWSRLWYGGGLDSRENAFAVLDAGADAVIVGNVFHEIAEEEQALFEEAVDEMAPDANFEEIRTWVAAYVDGDDSTAVNYLSTIPSVSDPVKTARAYLSRTIEFLLRVEGVNRDASERSDPLSSTAELRRFVEKAGPYESASTALGPVAGSAGRRIAREFALAKVADQVGIDVDVGLPISHVGVDDGQEDSEVDGLEPPV